MLRDCAVLNSRSRSAILRPVRKRCPIISTGPTFRVFCVRLLWRIEGFSDFWSAAFPATLLRGAFLSAFFAIIRPSSLLRLRICRRCCAADLIALKIRGHRNFHPNRLPAKFSTIAFCTVSHTPSLFMSPILPLATRGTSNGAHKISFAFCRILAFSLLGRVAVIRYRQNEVRLRSAAERSHGPHFFTLCSSHIFALPGGCSGNRWPLPIRSWLGRNIAVDHTAGYLSDFEGQGRPIVIRPGLSEHSDSPIWLP